MPSSRSATTLYFDNAATSWPKPPGVAEVMVHVMCCVGLHCAPAAHKTLGTFPSGTVRLALGAFTTADQISRALSAVGEIAHSQGPAARP